MLAFAYLPVVQYSLTINVPGFQYGEEGLLLCQQQVGSTHNVTNQTAYAKCIEQYRWQPINFAGRAPLMYKLLGLGPSPFPRIVRVSEGSFHAALFVSGTRVTAAEEIRPGAMLNPQGIDIMNNSLSVGSFGLANVTISVTNTGTLPIAGLTLYLSVPGESGNSTDSSGVVWMFSWRVPRSFAQFDLCGGRQMSSVSPGDTCTLTLHPVLSAPRGIPFRYSVEARGAIDNQSFVVRRAFSYTIPAQTIDKLWVAKFINLVNSARAGSTLFESASLDRFAALRFATAVTQPAISDYGLDGDLANFYALNPGQSQIVEVLLYPAGQVPTSYAASLQGFGPGHWSALTNKNFTHFGYYVGTGAYEAVGLPCPNTEIPGPGLNITRFFEAQSCSVSLIHTT
jgi:hypothetical protein